MEASYVLATNRRQPSPGKGSERRLPTCLEAGELLPAPQPPALAFHQTLEAGKAAHPHRPHSLAPHMAALAAIKPPAVFAGEDDESGLPAPPLPGPAVH